MIVHTMEFGTGEKDARALDGLLRSVESGEVDTIRVREGRLTVVLAPRPAPRPRRRVLAVR